MLCAMTRKIPKQSEGLNFIDPDSVSDPYQETIDMDPGSVKN